MTYVSPHGKPEGLADRLERFADTLCMNKTYPWLGTGIIDDIRCAVAMLTGKSVPPTMEQEMAAEELEYDL